MFSEQYFDSLPIHNLILAEKHLFLIILGALFSCVCYIFLYWIIKATLYMKVWCMKQHQLSNGRLLLKIGQ